MFLLRKLPILSLLVITPFLSKGQDICATATPFPALINGVQSCLSGSTVGAIAEVPYTFQSNCQGGGAMASPAEDVWFSFTAVGNLLDLDITGSTMSGISVGFYEGTCAGLIGRGCATSNTNSLSTTFSPVVAGTTYYVLSLIHI